MGAVNGGKSEAMEMRRGNVLSSITWKDSSGVIQVQMVKMQNHVFLLTGCPLAMSVKTENPTLVGQGFSDNSHLHDKGVKDIT